ncbi:MAG: M3 family oligoendopeptidase [Patescibacteria group bacterium]|nr:M3 family oligoendopeptidase [Patescibacteria group bacterium]
MLEQSKVKTNWDLSSLFSDDNDKMMDERLAAVENAADFFVNKWQSRQDYLADGKILKEALDDYENWQRNYGEDGGLCYYFERRVSLEQNNPEVKAKYNKYFNLAVATSNKIQFFTLSLAKIIPEKQKEFLADNNFTEYHHFLEKIFNKASHFLSEPEEALINLKYLSAHDSWVKLVSGALSKESRQLLMDNGTLEDCSFEKILALIDNQNKEVRNRAAEAVNEILTKHLSLGEAEFNAILENKKVDDELRKFTRPDESRHLSDDISSESIDLLLSSVANRFDISQRFYQLKAALFGQEKLTYPERNIAYGNLNKEFSFAEATDLVYKVLNNLDQKFADIFQGFLESGQVDAYPKVGKTGGAYCAYDLLTQPVYVLLNFTGKLQEVITIAHEFGHAINDELMREKQNSLNFGTPMATAEVASTFIESFVLDEIKKSADEELKLAIMMMQLNGVVSSIFRQVACYQFEQELHSSFRQSGYLSAKEISGLFSKHMKNYLGDSVDFSDGSENWWLYWSHLRTFFYVYSYASGLLIAKSMQSAYRQDKNYLEKIKEFLSAGKSASPEDIFLKLGIDIKNAKFWESGLSEVDSLLSEATELAKKLGKN